MPGLAAGPLRLVGRGRGVAVCGLPHLLEGGGTLLLLVREAFAVLRRRVQRADEVGGGGGPRGEGGRGARSASRIATATRAERSAAARWRRTFSAACQAECSVRASVSSRRWAAALFSAAASAREACR